MTRLDCHWVEKDSTAQAELERQGYAARDHRLGPRSEKTGKRFYYVLMCKEV